MRLLDDGISGQPWQHGGQGPRQQEEGGAITSYGAGCAQFVRRRRRGGEGGHSKLHCTHLCSTLPPLRCGVVQSLNHRKLAGLLKREEGQPVRGPGVGIGGVEKEGEGEL